jgi:hypothetical protein
MGKLRRFYLPLIPLALVLAGLNARLGGSPAPDLPASLSDRDFWRLSEDLSEPDGSFLSDNLVSNELVFPRLVPLLGDTMKPGGVYLGVGPEQNYTYIAAMQPRMVFITDIRRGNLHLHLMYKALFALSADRIEFLSRLFTKPRPDGLPADAGVTDLMNAYWDAFTSSEAAYERNLREIVEQLTRRQSIPLSAADLDGIARVYRAFYWYGPSITYSARVALTPVTPTARGVTYWDLMTQTGADGRGLSYLGSEASFAIVKDLHRRNLIVPVVGNFAGSKALRAVGAYLRTNGATVSAFYVSNVESYLQRDGSWPRFCQNVATMPIDETSVFIRPSSGRVTMTTRAPNIVNGIFYFNNSPSGGGLVPIATDLKRCAG